MSTSTVPWVDARHHAHGVAGRGFVHRGLDRNRQGLTMMTRPVPR